MEELMRVLMIWLSASFGLPEGAPLPDVHHLPRHHLHENYHGYGSTTERDHVVGLYFDTTQTIFLYSGWNSRDIKDLSILVYELTHYQQRQMLNTYSCAEEKEALPFEAQQRFLGYFGQDLQTSFGIDPDSLIKRTICLR